MATRNPANVIEFGKFNYGATMTDWEITAAADISGEVNPGEEMEADHAERNSPARPSDTKCARSALALRSPRPLTALLDPATGAPRSIMAA